VKPYQKYLTHKRAGGVAEVVKHLYTYSPEFKLQYHQKIEKSKEFLLCERYFLKKIFVKYITDKELLSKIYKEFLKFSNQKTNDPVKERS
jgi:hypothetical protein